VTKCVSHDAGEALIKEAKQRARRRRWIYGGTAVVLAITALAGLSSLTSSTSPPHGAAQHIPAQPAPPPLAAGPPSTPATGQLVAALSIPLWVYEDGRVISARWTTGDHWTGFLEQRLTPEGVELVRAEILALEPVSACRGAVGNVWYGDGARDVCETPGMYGIDIDHPEYQPLSELQSGAASWLPARAWADPEPKPYVPSGYLIGISRGFGPMAPPIDTAAMFAAFPTEVAGLLTSPEPCPEFGEPPRPGDTRLEHPEFYASPASRVCFLQVTTDVARRVAAAFGFTEADVRSNGLNPMFAAGYRIAFTPYLPHGNPVACCAG